MKQRNLVIGLILSIIFLWIALHGLDWQSMAEILRTARWQYVLLATLIWSAGLATRAARWRVLLASKLRGLAVFHILNIGFLINNTMPLRIGELARAYLAGRTEPAVSGWSALSTIVAERIIDMLAVVLMLVAVLPVMAVDQAAVSAGLAMGGLALAGFGVLIFFAHKPAWAHGMLNLAMRILPVLRRLNLSALLERVLAGLQPLTTRRGLLGATGWTAASWLLSAAGSWVLALAFPSMPSTPLMRAALTLSVVAASFSIIIPFTLASVGPFEAAAIFALMTASVSQELAAAYAVIWHTGVVLTYALWGTVGILSLGISFDQIRKGAEHMQK